jgi:hypothetical protein
VEDHRSPADEVIGVEWGLMKSMVMVMVVGLGCGDNGTRAVDAPITRDVSSIDAPVLEASCDPLAQTGCEPTEACTWIIDHDGTGTAPDVGHIGCVASGTLAAGASCTIPSAATGGHDNCGRGTYCLDGTCQALCDPDPANGDSCSIYGLQACVSYDNVFEVGTTTVAGICEVTCDPLTQTTRDNDTPACGSPSPAAPTRGCFSSNNQIYSCSPTVASRYTKTDGVAAADADGVAWNSCAPGYMPFFVQHEGSTTAICSGLCAPLDTNSVMPANSRGDATVLAKQPTDPAPVAGHARCTPFAVGGKGSIANEQCSYLWTIVVDGDTFTGSQYDNTVGYCFTYGGYDYDPANGTDYTTPMAGCAALPAPTAATSGVYDDAFDWGCSSTVYDFPPDATPMIWHERATGVTKMRVRRRL